LGIPTVADVHTGSDDAYAASILSHPRHRREVPLALRRHRRLIRLDPKPSGAFAVLVVAVAAALLTGGWMMLGHSHVSALPSMPGSASPAGGSVAASSSSRPGTLVVDVTGKVRRPGLYRLAAGARVDDAVRAAGGALAGADLSTVNLARKLADGEQLAVGVATTTATPTPSAGSAGGLVNLNTASEAELDALPGVGPVLAQHILAWRSTHGPFSAVDQLRQVSGIGPAKFADIRPRVTV
jgi:competence protein ComEA